MAKNGKSRYAKKHHGTSQAIPKRMPSVEYISSCCNLPAHKPSCDRKDQVQDPESRKIKEVPKGLGKWKCPCGKKCKVVPRKIQPVVVELKNALDAAMKGIEGLIKGAPSAPRT